MNPSTLARWGRWILWSFPVFAFFFRRHAMKRLVEHAQLPEVPALLVAALGSTDGRVALSVKETLRSLDASAHTIPALADGTSADSPEVAAEARQLLASLTRPTDIDALVGLVLSDAQYEGLLPLIATAKYRHSDEGSQWLLLALAGRFDEYLRQDVEFRGLSAAYPKAPTQLRQRIRATATRVGDARMVGLFVSLVSCSFATAAREAEEVLSSLTRPTEIDAFLGLALSDARYEHLLPLIAKAKYRHSDEGSHFLLLAVAGRFSEYLGKDAEFRRLRAEYQKATPQLRQRICASFARGAEAKMIGLFAHLASADAPAVVAEAKQVLSSLTRPAEIDALLGLVLSDAQYEHLFPLIATAKYRHSDEGSQFLLLALGGRFDEYLAEDFEFQRLRAEYQGAPAALQQRIRATITRIGDVRMNGLFVTERKSTTLGDLTDEEAALLVEVNAKHGNWATLFKYLDILPARSMAVALRRMQSAGWHPEAVDDGALYDRLLGIVGEFSDAPATAGPPVSPAMQLWLTRGTTGEYSKLADAELREKLNDEHCDEDWISAMAALQKRGKLTQADLEAGAKSEQWLVRIATCILGGPPPAKEPGGSLWIERLNPVLSADAVWRGKPCEVSRDGLEALQEGLARMPDKRTAGGLLLVEAVASHVMAHDIEIDLGAKVTLTEDTIEIEG